MPPKKDSKKQAQAKPDNSGIPKQDVEFKFSLVVKSDNPEPPNYAIMFEWFGSLSDKIERYQCPTIDSWKRQGNSYSFEKQLDIVRVEDDFCKSITSRQFYIYFVNADDNKVEDQLNMDYSSLIYFNQAQPKFSFESNTIRVLSIDSFSLTLTADKPLLGQVYRHYLNPMEVEVIGAKDLPVEHSSKYEPVYVKYSLFGDMNAQTNPLVGSDKLLWSHKHVFLIGLINPSQLKQKMRSRYVKFQLHDRDEVNNKKLKSDIELFDITRAIQEEMEKQKPVEEDPKKKGQPKKEEKKEVKKEAKKEAKKKDAKLGQPILAPKPEIVSNNYGVSACSLIQFLKPSMRSARYKVPVVPKNMFQDFESKNIDLNTTARNEMQKVIVSNNYFDCDTVLVVGFSLAHPIGTFVKPEVKQQPVVDDKKGKKEVKQVKQAVPQRKQPVKQLGRDVFERVVYVVPYKDAAWMKQIEDIFYNINMRAFNLKSKREISTHLLSPQEMQDRSLDFVTGIQIADPQGRIYILEGLKAASIQQFHKQIIKNAPNSKDRKIFKNSNLSFTDRLFSQFHLELKRIRLRPCLSQLLLEPSIYIKSKVAEQICQTLNKLADLRKICDDLTTADSMNLWPHAQWLIQIERKFSQSLSQQDIFGQEPKLTKKNLNSTSQAQKTIKLLENTDLKIVTSDQFFLPKISQAQVTHSPPQMTQTTKRPEMTKTFTKDAGKNQATYQMRGKSSDLGLNDRVYVYAGQKNNFYDQQMRQLREEMRKNPNIIYTYDKDFFRLAIDPFTLEQEKKKDLQLSMSKMFSKDKFSSLLVKTKQERMRLPDRITDQDARDILQYPYHEQKQIEKQMNKNLRDIPLPDGKDFKKYLRRQELFSEYHPIEGEKLSPVQQQIINRQHRKRVAEEEEQKLKGDPTIHIKKCYFGDKSYGADRFKDIREGDAKKLGFMDVKKRSKDKVPIDPLEVSYNLKEDVINPSYNPLIRRDNTHLNIQKDEFNFYQGPEILTRTQVYKPLKDIL